MITVENKTGKDITLISLSDEDIKTEVPVAVKAGGSAKIYSDSMRLSGVDIIFSYNEKKYKVNTGYADDYWSYTVRFSEGADGEIECFFVASEFLGLGGTHSLHLKEIY